MLPIIFTVFALTFGCRHINTSETELSMTPPVILNAHVEDSLQNTVRDPIVCKDGQVPNELQLVVHSTGTKPVSNVRVRTQTGEDSVTLTKVSESTFAAPLNTVPHIDPSACHGDGTLDLVIEAAPMDDWKIVSTPLKLSTAPETRLSH